MNPPLWRRARVFGRSGRYGGWLLAAYVICLFWIGAGIEEYVRLADPAGGHPYPLWAAPLVGLLGAVVLVTFWRSADAGRTRARTREGRSCAREVHASYGRPL